MSIPLADDSVVLHHGDALDILRELPDASIDAVVTDPPYGLEFMGKEWDGADGFRRSLNQADAGRNSVFGRASRTSPEYRTSAARSGMNTFQMWCTEWAAECLRVLKPGGHLLAFGGSRTSHRLACGVEDAGFEIRDSIAWLYGSGFPKSRNLDGAWPGWGTALKPAFEPVVVGRKPLVGTVAHNVAAHSTGALHIDACRIGSEERTNPAGGVSSLQRVSRVEHGYRDTVTASVGEASTVTGRWPTNVVLDATTAADLDDQMPGASQYFPVFRYEAKASSAERPEVNGVRHPTVKPLNFMRWLVRLVTPPGGTVLDPFAGSGTTAEACVLERFRCIAIERELDYLPLIVARLSKPIEMGFDFEGGAS